MESADCNDLICFSSFPYWLQKITLCTECTYPFLSGWNIFIAKFSSSCISPGAQALFTEQQALSHSLSGHNKSSCSPEPSCCIRLSEERWTQTETPRSLLPFLEPRLLKTKKHYVGVSLQPSGPQHNQKWKIPPKIWKGGARLKRVLTSVANGPSPALLSWVCLGTSPPGPQVCQNHNMPFVLLPWTRLVQGKPGCAPRTMALFFQVPEERFECRRSSAAGGKQ